MTTVKRYRSVICKQPNVAQLLTSPVTSVCLISITLWTQNCAQTMLSSTPQHSYLPEGLTCAYYSSLALHRLTLICCISTANVILGRRLKSHLFQLA